MFSLPQWNLQSWISFMKGLRLKIFSFPQNTFYFNNVRNNFFLYKKVTQRFLSRIIGMFRKAKMVDLSRGRPYARNV